MSCPALDRNAMQCFIPSRRRPTCHFVVLLERTPFRFAWSGFAARDSRPFLDRLKCPVPEIRGILPEGSWLFFKARAKRPYPSHTGRASNAEKRPTGPGRRVAMKMGRRPRCSSVTYRFRYAPSSRLAGGPF